MPLDRFLVVAAANNGHSPHGPAMHEIPESLVRRLRVAQAGAKLIGQATNFVKAIAQLPAIAPPERNSSHERSTLHRRAPHPRSSL